MRVGGVVRSGYGPINTLRRTGAVDDRAGAGGGRCRASTACSSATTTTCRCPTTRTSRCSGGCSRSGTTGPAGALFLLPLWHPVLVAEQIGTLASIAAGRSSCSARSAAAPSSSPRSARRAKQRPSRFEASLDIVRRLCAGEEVTIESPFEIQRARIAPVPPEPLEVWIGAAAPPAIDRAARLGDAFLVGPEATPAEARELMAAYREACARHGVHAERRSRSAATSTSAPTTPMRTGSPDRSSTRATAVSTRRRRSWAAPRRSPRAFAELGEMGYTDVIVRHLADDQTEVLRSFERLAEVRATVSAAESGRMRCGTPLDRRPSRAATTSSARLPRAAVRARHRVPRRTLVLAPARADPDRVARRHRARRPARGRPRAARRGPRRAATAWWRTRPTRISRSSSACAGTAADALFDTQVAAGFLGLGAPSLVALVESMLGMRLAKGDRLTDWTAGRCAPSSSVYAAADVEHLLALQRRARRAARTRSAGSSGRSTSARTAARDAHPRPTRSRVVADQGCAPTAGPVARRRAGSRRRGANAPPRARRAASLRALRPRARRDRAAAAALPRGAVRHPRHRRPVHRGRHRRRASSRRSKTGARRSSRRELRLPETDRIDRIAGAGRHGARCMARAARRRAATSTRACSRPEPTSRRCCRATRAGSRRVGERSWSASRCDGSSRERPCSR